MPSPEGDEAVEAVEPPALLSFQVGGDSAAESRLIPFNFSDYVELLDWTGRAVRDDKRGFIPGSAPPILQRLNLTPQQWLRFMPQVQCGFSRAVGRQSALKALAAKFEVAWLQGQGLLPA